MDDVHEVIYVQRSALCMKLVQFGYQDPGCSGAKVIVYITCNINHFVATNFFELTYQPNISVKRSDRNVLYTVQHYCLFIVECSDHFHCQTSPGTHDRASLCHSI